MSGFSEGVAEEALLEWFSSLGYAIARGPVEVEHAIKQIVAEAIAAAGVIDVFEAAGLPKPDISILSEEFLGQVRRLPQKNLAVELLRKLLTDDLRVRARKNLVQSRTFSAMLEEAIHRYNAKAIETAQVIEELIALAKEMREAQDRGAKLGLSDEELAFYDALETSDSAVAVLGDETLRTIAREVTETIRRNASIDFTIREDVRANLRRLVRRVLRKHGYPPDRQEAATRTVLAQAELLGLDLVESGAAAPAEPPRVLPFRRLEARDVRAVQQRTPAVRPRDRGRRVREHAGARAGSVGRAARSDEARVRRLRRARRRRVDESPDPERRALRIPHIGRRLSEWTGAAGAASRHRRSRSRRHVHGEDLSEREGR